MRLAVIMNDGGSDTVDLTYIIRIYHLLRCAISKNTPLVQHQDTVGVARRQIQVMQCHQHRELPLPAEIPDQVHHFQLVTDIKVCGRLIQ